MQGLTFLLSDKGELVNEGRFPDIDPRGVTIGLDSWSLGVGNCDGVFGIGC